MDESLAFNDTCSDTKFFGTTVMHLQQQEEEEVEHGQNVKMHFSITLDISGIFIYYLVYTFVSTCFVMQKY